MEDKRICAGLLAHVDAGKTTLSEGLLYLCGNIREAGRVDKGNTLLDNNEMERKRGITIFSKQVILTLPDHIREEAEKRGIRMRSDPHPDEAGQGERTVITLLDTPGHVDFSSEMERTLQVLDYAVLLIGGKDGVQGHTMTLWRLLELYQVPVFIFINKMDQEGADQAALLRELQQRLSENCVDFSETDRETFLENVSMCDESLMEQYLSEGDLLPGEISDGIAGRRIYPCYFGSALKMEGVAEFLDGLGRYTRKKEYPSEFAARVFKISRDEQGSRLTHLKVTGGSLKVKSILEGIRLKKAPSDALAGEEAGDTAGFVEHWSEKVDQIRLYSGAKYELTPAAEAGCICAVTGLSGTYPGEGLGGQQEAQLPMLEPVLNYQLILPADCDPPRMLRWMRQLEEEDPQLHVVWDERLKEIHVMLMGEVQTDILRTVIWDRFHTVVDFGPGSIVYKETLAAPVIGIGHFEPLRHYAEVHLLLEPGERGSGVTVFTACSEDILAKNWQRLILTHLTEKEHIGVLTGSAVTDIQITLINGKAHIKHTEGGDFRQATYRAVRNGLKKGTSLLLEPCYEFRLELPAELAGRAMGDIQRMKGSFLPIEIEGDMAVLTGSAPVSAMREYPKEVLAYTGGRGRIFCSLKGYEPVEEAEAVIEEIGYDSERDLDNPTSSVFCAHGAGFIVPWDQVEDYMHLEDQARIMAETQEWDIPEPAVKPAAPSRKAQGAAAMGSYEQDKELMAIFERTFGPVKKERFRHSAPAVYYGSESEKSADERQAKKSSPVSRRTDPVSRRKSQEEYLLVDGYNIIFAWENLRELAKTDIHSAALSLIDIMGNYQGLIGGTVIVVFDSYKVPGHEEEIMHYHNVDVVYTKEAETADMYIERTAHKLGKNNKVTVATSDGLEQIIILGQGALRLSAAGLWKEIEAVEKEMRSDWHSRRIDSKSYLLDSVAGELREWMGK